MVKKLRIEANLEASRNTFERVAREWHEKVKGQWAAIHSNDVLRSLERDVLPIIGELLHGWPQPLNLIIIALTM